MTQFVGNTVAAFQATVGGMFLSIQDEIHDDRHTGRQYWDYQQRGSQSTRDQQSFFSLWPASRIGGADPTGAAGNNLILGSDWSSTQQNNYSFEWTSLGDSGTLRPYYIKGQCIDNTSTPVVGALVDLYVATGNPVTGDIWVSSGVSNSGGWYSLPTQFYTANHYVVATFTGGSTISGTTVQTLIPSA